MSGRLERGDRQVGGQDPADQVGDGRGEREEVERDDQAGAERARASR